MDLSGIENHAMYGKYPCRLPVWWGLFGEVGLDPEIKHISGKKVVLRIEKDLIDLRKYWQNYFAHQKRYEGHLTQRIACYGNCAMVHVNLNRYVQF